MKKLDRQILNKEEIASLLKDKPQYRDCLFASGYLFTDNEQINDQNYPFYGSWKKNTAGKYHIFVHPIESVYIMNASEVYYVLIGHAYNPFRLIHDENVLLQSLAGTSCESELLSQIDEWTGAFVLFIIKENDVKIITDPTALKMCHCCTEDGHMYVAAHAQMLADIFGYSMTEYAFQIRQTRMFNTGMRWLPGDTTAYENIKRIGSNLLFTYRNGIFNQERIFPLVPHEEYHTQKEKEKAAKELTEIVRNGIELCLKKWGRCALSLTGGMDSGAEFSCTVGFTDKLEIMSYDCKEQEKIDSAAAKERCKIIGVEHKQYHIPENENELEDYDLLSKIIDHNTSYIKNLAPEEIRKIIFFHRNHTFDVELKAEVAEIGRAFYDQKYGMCMPDSFTARQVAMLQTRFFFMPILQSQTIKIYKKHLHDIGLEKGILNYEHSDLLYWEYRMSAAMGLTALSMGMAHYQSFPYNNRIFLEKMLAFPHADRKNDLQQKLMIQQNMPQIFKENMKVKNRYLGKRRMMAENIFFRMKSIGL